MNETEMFKAKIWFNSFFENTSPLVMKCLWYLQFLFIQIRNERRKPLMKMKDIYRIPKDRFPYIGKTIQWPLKRNMVLRQIKSVSHWFFFLKKILITNASGFGISISQVEINILIVVKCWFMTSHFASFPQ